MQILSWLTPFIWIVLMGGLVIFCGVIWIIEFINTIRRFFK